MFRSVCIDRGQYRFTGSSMELQADLNEYVHSAKMDEECNYRSRANEKTNIVIMEEYKDKCHDQYIQHNTEQQSQLLSKTCAAVDDRYPVYENLVPNGNNSTNALPRKGWRKKEFSRVAGFMFWTNCAGVILMLVGFITPGWLTVKIRQYFDLDSYYKRNSNLYVYQDYSLWYVTQCYDPGTGTACQTMSYRSINALYGTECDCNKISIGSMETTDTHNLLLFSDAALVFSYSEIVRSQALYTVGLMLALSTLYAWYNIRRGVAEGKLTGLSKKKWVFLFILAFLSALSVFVPVFMYVAVATQITDSYSDEMKSPLGVVIAGFGGGMMIFCYAAILMYQQCCKNEDDDYKRNTRTEYGMHVPQEKRLCRAQSI